MKKSCKNIENMLVDYADGRLSPGESGQVSEHLTRCENCRGLLDALQKSLDLAGVIWADGLAETKAIRIPTLRKVRKSHRLRYAALAASILLVVSAFTAWRALVKPVEIQKEPSFAEIERKITDEGTAARLLAATDLLADRPNAGTLVQSQYEYIVDRYPNTKAAAAAKAKIQ
jgi:hypothetical protein